MQSVMLGIAKLCTFSFQVMELSHSATRWGNVAGDSKNDPPSDAQPGWENEKEGIERLRNLIVELISESSYVLRPLQTILYWVSKVHLSPNSLHLTGKYASIYMNLVTFWQ